MPEGQQKPTECPSAWSQGEGGPRSLTQTDQHPLQGLVAGRLQVEEREFVVCAQLYLMPDGLKEGGGPVELWGGGRVSGGSLVAADSPGSLTVGGLCYQEGGQASSRKQVCSPPPPVRPCRPDAEPPPGSRWPKGRGPGRVGSWLRPPCAPAAPPAASLQRHRKGWFCHLPRCPTVGGGPQGHGRAFGGSSLLSLSLSAAHASVHLGSLPSGLCQAPDSCPHKRCCPWARLNSPGLGTSPGTQATAPAAAAAWPPRIGPSLPPATHLPAGT